MTIHWEKVIAKGGQYQGKTGSHFSARIAMSTNPGKYVWTECHDDFRYVVIGGEVDTIDAAKKQSRDWLIENAIISD